MRPMTRHLSELLDRDPAAEAYFRALPPFIRETLSGMEIMSMEDLQAHAVRIQFVPF